MSTPSSSNRSPLVQQLVQAGSTATTTRKDEKLNQAAEVVGELFSDVDAGTRPVSDLDTLIDMVQNASGGSQPQPAALPSSNSGSGSNSSATPTEDEALNVIVNSPTLPVGVKMAIKRLLVPSDPDYIRVKDDGTPEAIVNLQNEVTAKERARKDLETKLSDEKDENKSGSLAQQLKEAKAAAATPADTVKKKDVKDALKKVEEAEDNLSTSMMSRDVDGRDELEATINAAKQLVS